MVSLPWSTVIVGIAVAILGGVIVWLWQKNGRNGKLGRPGPRGLSGLAGLNGRDGRDGRDSRVTLTEATADLIVELSSEVEQLKLKVHALELGAQDAQNRITMLQGELALANQEVSALELLIKEQAARIGDLRAENDQLRRSVVRVMRKTGALTGALLDDSDPSPER